MAREYTQKLTDMAEEGAIDWETIARECLARMSEDEVEDMCVECDWIEPEDEEEEEEEEDDSGEEDEEDDSEDDRPEKTADKTGWDEIDW